MDRVSLCRESVLPISLAGVRLGRASREAESFSGGHGQRTEGKGYLLAR